MGACRCILTSFASHSCSSPDVYRAMEFVVAMLQRLHDDLELPLPQAASEAYYATLHQYHGWITSAAFIVALKACLHSFSRHLCCLAGRRCQVQIVWHRWCCGRMSIVWAADLHAMHRRPMDL